MNYNNALSYSTQWLDIIKQEHFLKRLKPNGSLMNRKIILPSISIAAGWRYRKSVTEAGDWASVEWSGKGSTITDVFGRKYIDWLGGFGMFDLGWKHPEVVAAVTAQLQRSPCPRRS
ncbi:MAG: hypothetical protein U0X93_16790 [Anaerolineales bacterium]